jgi:hypothetical protein
LLGLSMQSDLVGKTRQFPNEFPTLPATSRRFLLKLCHGTHSQLLHYRPY